MNKPVITLNGGSGFIGRAIANRCVEAGYHVRILTRTRGNARECWLLPDTDVIEVSARSPEDIAAACAGSEAVVNLVGILNEGRDNGDGFREVHVEGTRRILAACKTAHVPHLVQFSALNADSFGASYYLRSKGEAEKLLNDEAGQNPVVTIVRPSVVFGPHDDFTNRFATLLAMSPVLPLAGAQTRFQPVYVGDVAEAVLRIVTQRGARGRRYDFGGPDVLTLRELVDYVATVTGRQRLVINLGPLLANIQANVFEYVPGKPFSRDNLRSLEADSVCADSNGIVELGITPRSMREIVPQYLGDGKLRHNYYAYRAEAGRD